MSILQATLNLSKIVNYFTTTFTTGTSITIPSTSQVGDLCIIHNQAGVALGTCTPVTPAGFTNVVNTGGSDGSQNQRMMVSYKVLVSGDPGSTVSGMTQGPPTARLMIFRPANFTLSSITTSTVSQQTTPSKPTNQTIVLGAESVKRPLISWASFGANSKTVSGASVTGGPTYTTLTHSYGLVSYAILNEGQNSTDSTVSMSDNGNNSLASLTFSFN